MKERPNPCPGQTYWNNGKYFVIWEVQSQIIKGTMLPKGGGLPRRHILRRGIPAHYIFLR
jgi:hypothetical protein